MTSIRHLCLNLFQQEPSFLSLAKKRGRLRGMMTTALKLCFQVFFNAVALVSGCFRTRKYAEAYCRISSYLQTMANQGYHLLVAIQMASSGQIYADGGE